MTRRQFFGRMFAAAVVAVLLHSGITRYLNQSRSLQWMLDWGVPIPPGSYAVDRTLHIRRNRTTVAGSEFDFGGAPLGFSADGVSDVVFSNVTFRNVGTAIEFKRAHRFTADSLNWTRHSIAAYS